jgi:uncharacterized membrane protein
MKKYYGILGIITGAMLYDYFKESHVDLLFHSGMAWASLLLFIGEKTLFKNE